MPVINGRAVGVGSGVGMTVAVSVGIKVADAAGVSVAVEVGVSARLQLLNKKINNKEIQNFIFMMRYAIDYLFSTTTSFSEEI
jgi:hypothetical protein